MNLLVPRPKERVDPGEARWSDQTTCKPPDRLQKRGVRKVLD